MLIKNLDSHTLKKIAAVSMLIDHIGYLFIGSGIGRMYGNNTPEYEMWYQIYCIMRTAGRVAFPIYVFLLTEGIFYTRNWKKYGLRLGIFAVLSEIPFNLMTYGTLTAWEVQNVFFTLLIGLLTVKTAEYLCKNITFNSKNQYDLFFWLVTGLGGCILAIWMNTDYSYIGVLLTVFFYCYRFDRKIQCMGGFLWLFSTLGKIYYIWGLSAAFLLIYFYNGKKGSGRGKYLFYLFYPAHLLLLYWIYCLIF